MRVEIKNVGIQTETLKDVKTLEDLHTKEIFSHLSEEEQFEAEEELLSILNENSEEDASE